MTLHAEWRDPPREFSLAPFWFWNDDLSEAEIARQLDDFQRHGVHAFVLHPRVGLPRSIGWLSQRMLAFMRFAIEQAAARGMWVILYDEGMYPSGSSSGQVVAENPAYHCRGLVAIDLDAAQPGADLGGVRIGSDGLPVLAPEQTLVAVVPRASDGHRLAIVDKPVDAVIRGLHYLEDDPPRRPDRRDPPEDTPPAADLLNEAAVACFVRLVYQRFYDAFGDHFGTTIRAIFTDEPDLLGRLRERRARAGTTGILEHVNAWLGYDFTPHLPALWYDDEPDAARYRRDYYRALQARMEQTYYRQLYTWCDTHGIALTGHPARPDDIGHLRYFHIPGQDIVWRYIEPDTPGALAGEQSTQAKCAASAMLHLGRRRNLNEFCGAYGPDLTYAEMVWMAHWLIVRGCNLLTPHAFYYSVRGPRIDERPPDVGPHSPWWEHYLPFADRCRRLCWLNTDSRHVCEVAILGTNDHLPWRAAKVCFEQQRDFNYLEARHLWEDARVDAAGIQVGSMHYAALIIEEEPPVEALPALERLQAAGRLIDWREVGAGGVIDQLDRLVSPDLAVEPHAPGLRARHVVKDGADYYIVFNECRTPIEARLRVAAAGDWLWLDPESGVATPAADDRLALQGHACQVLMVA